MLKIKAIDLLKLYRSNLINNQKIEIRVGNWIKKIVIYKDFNYLLKEPLLQRNIEDWFIGSNVTDGDIIINIEEVSNENI